MAFKACNGDALLDLFNSMGGLKLSEKEQLLDELQSAMSDFADPNCLTSQSGNSIAGMLPQKAPKDNHMVHDELQTAMSDFADPNNCSTSQSGDSIAGMLPQKAPKDNHMVHDLQQELRQTTMKLECKLSELSAAQNQLQTACEKILHQQSCLHKREEQVLDLKLELALHKQKAQHATEESTSKNNVADNDSIAVDAKLQVYGDLLQQKEEELNKCAARVIELDVAKKALRTQVLKMEELLSLRKAQQDSSMIEQQQSPFIRSRSVVPSPKVPIRVTPGSPSGQARVLTQSYSVQVPGVPPSPSVQSRVLPQPSSDPAHALQKSFALGRKLQAQLEILEQSKEFVQIRRNESNKAIQTATGNLAQW